MITLRPRRISSRQSSGSGSRARMASRLPAIDLMGASELFNSCPSTRTSRCQACNSCSLKACVRSEITSSSSGSPRSRMRVRRTPQRPAPPGNTACSVVCCRPVQADVQLQFLRRLPQQPFGGSGQQPLAGAIHQPQPLVLVERKNGDIDFPHHRAQQRGGFHRSQPLFAQRAAQRVDLAHDFAQRVVGPRRAAAHRKIALAQRAQQVGKRLQREHHALAHRQGKAQPGAHNQHRQRPLRCADRVIRRSTASTSATVEPGNPASNASSTTRPS